MIKVNPQLLLRGFWLDGHALDLHTVHSELIVLDEKGVGQFNTQRTQLGELVYRVKYHDDQRPVNEIVEVAANYVLNEWKIADKIDFIIPVPPSNATRVYQPVMSIAMALGLRMNIRVRNDILIKTRSTEELKNIVEYDTRRKMLAGVFKVKSSATQGMRVLLFDDLYRSGATLQTITRVLKEEGRVKAVYVLTLTKTRTKT